MADLDQWWGQDLSLTPQGDLALSTGLNEDNQAIFRRLCTNGGQSGGEVAEYLFHPNYGGSASWYVGQAGIDVLNLEGIIRAQMYLEASVGHNPEPTITVTINPNGTYSAQIGYYNTNIDETVPPLFLDVTG